jgi:single-strand DNA-binding protein
MPYVRVEQRHAHLAGPVRLDFVNGPDGKLARATLTAISNTRRRSGEERQEEATAVQWTLWGRQAENAAAYLGKGSHVNIVGHLRNNNYPSADGETVYALAFSAEEIDYLDSKAEADARRGRHEFVAEMDASERQQAPARGQPHRTSSRPAGAAT